MVSIRPFKGILYNQDKISNLSDVVTPPYDVISPAEQDNLYSLSNYNIIRIILGKEDSGDNQLENKYTRAARTFEEWLNTGILKQDDIPAIYVYQQEYNLKNGKMTKRIGLISLVKLESLEDGRIRPHEKTLSKPKQDRFNLLCASKASFSQIFCLFSDPKKDMKPILEDITKAKPELEFYDNDGLLNQVWKVTDVSTINKIVRIMEDKTLYIADGHHRYETALKYQQKMINTISNQGNDDLYNYAMMMLVDMDSQDLTVLPIHRVLMNLDEESVARLIVNLEAYFDIEVFDFSPLNELAVRNEFFNKLKNSGDNKHVFGMYSGNPSYYLLTLKNEEILDQVLQNDSAKKWKKLDVAILHSLIIDYLLHVKSTESGIQSHIEHVKDEDVAIEMVNSGGSQIAFFLNPTKVSQVKEISSQRQILPQKSTFFYPKLLTGLVIFKLDQ